MQALSARPRLFGPSLSSALFLIAASLATGCNSFHQGNVSTAAGISATSSTIRVNQQLQMTPTALYPGDTLTYYVNGVQGGNADVGTISSTGLYTAPAVVPSPDTVVITTTSAMFSTAPKGSVSLAVWNPIPVLGTITPSGFTEGTTTVQVSGSEFVYGAQISWNGALIDTTYVSSTELVAQVAAPNPGTFPLTVTNPNPGSASANPVPVKVGPGKVGLRLDTSGGVDVRVLNTLTLGTNRQWNQ